MLDVCERDGCSEKVKAEGRRFCSISCGRLKDGIQSKSNSTRNAIAINAIRVMARSNFEKKCCICGFDEVDVAHIRPVKGFPDTALITEINDPRNLRYLCPNHHRKFDKGLIGFIPDLKGEPHFYTGKYGFKPMSPLNASPEKRLQLHPIP